MASVLNFNVYEREGGSLTEVGTVLSNLPRGAKVSFCPGTIGRFETKQKKGMSLLIKSGEESTTIPISFFLSTKALAALKADVAKKDVIANLVRLPLYQREDESLVIGRVGDPTGGEEEFTLAQIGKTAVTYEQLVAF